MRLYIWRKGFMADYTDGLGVAVADSVDEARGLLIRACVGDKAYAREWVAAGCSSEPDEVLDLPAAAFNPGGS